MNPMNFIKNYMLNGMTPKGIVQKMSGNNPILNNVIGMAENGNIKGVEEFARNICNQKGINFDKEFANFKNNLK